ncbi:MAG: tRNA (adenosine(37)-N6)-threonylcarbamoyltransferase complex ATPase subunit type 1 TsaE [Treponema sp.]|uniref:tRNA (adenosine(37)-N6)-threonylcarbamoyltransferase complex ATPase subunit type 1 TsaE n=1 Tax=Treponema sp. TaxID=166 RepID=UPI003FA1F238
MTFYTESAEQTIGLGEKIGSFLRPGDVIALQGTLAAGKTTITKGIARALGITEDITSPTFTLISVYEGRLPLYHMDVYRLEGSADFSDLGAEEMLYGNGICVIEWSEKIMDELPSRTIVIKLSAENEKRTVTIENWTYGDFTL